jgi:hypothetical protein
MVNKNEGGDKRNSKNIKFRRNYSISDRYVVGNRL